MPRRARRAPRLVWRQPLVAWLELQLVELMPTADRTGLKIRLRQEKIAPKIAPLKSFACSYRLGANSEKRQPVVASEQDNVITGTSAPTSSSRRTAGTTMWVLPTVVGATSLDA